MKKKHPLIAKAIRLAGSQVKLSSMTGIKQQVISRILACITPVQADHAAKIEIATGGKVTRRELRPDLFFPEIIPPDSDTRPPKPSLSTQDNGETGERPEKGSAACAAGEAGHIIAAAQADQVVATAGRIKRRPHAALPASDAALNSPAGRL